MVSLTKFETIPACRTACDTAVTPVRKGVDGKRVAIDPPEAVAQGVTRFESVRPELWRSDRSSSFQRDDGASGPMRPGAKTNTVRRQDAPLLYLLTDICSEQVAGALHLCAGNDALTLQRHRRVQRSPNKAPSGSQATLWAR